MIYKTVRTDLSRPEAASLAERLGITGDVDGYFGKFGIGDSSNHSYLQVSNSSNHVMYTANTTRWWRGSDKDKPENLPSDDEAVEIAKEFLNEKGLMPEDAVFRGTEHQALKAAVGFEHLVVSFGRELNGLPIVGDGSKISVEIGGYGDILKLLKVWREYEPYEEFSIIKPEEAIEKLKKGGISSDIMVDAVTINDIYLGYYAAPGSTKQTYLKPVYVFEGEARGRIDYHNESRHFVQHVAALQSFEE